jgi:signal transduction histidine kinase
MNNRFFRLIFLFSVVVQLQSAFNLNAQQQQYLIERINTEDGLQSNGIRGIELDAKKEFLWIATEFGLARYNGKAIETFKDSSSFPNKYRGRIRTLGLSNTGKILIVTEKSKLISVVENKFDADFKDIDLLFTEDFIYAKNGMPLPSKKFSTPTVIQEWEEFAVKGKKYVRLYRFLYALEKDSLKIVLKNSINNQFPFTINDRLFYVNKELQCVEWKGEGYTSFEYVNRLIIPSGAINKNYKIKLLHDPTVKKSYLIRGNFLFELTLQNNTIVPLKITDQLPDNENLQNLRVDTSRGIYYLGTENKGLIILRPRYFNLLQTKAFEFTSEQSLYAQLELPNGQIYMNSGDIYSFNNKGIIRNKFIKRAAFSNLFVSSDSTVYFADLDEIHAYSLAKNQVKIKIINPLKRPVVFTEYQKTIYCFSKNFAGHIDHLGKLVTDIPVNSNDLNCLIYDAKPIGNNLILIATSEGLVQFNITTKTIKNIYKSSIPNIAIRSIIPYKTYFFIGSTGAGPLVYFNGIVKEIPVDPMGYLNFSHCFLILKDGTVWITTNNGLFRTHADQLVKSYTNQNFKPNYEYFGKQEGLEVTELNGGCTPCALQLRDGSLSFPSVDGLIQFNPGAIPNMKKAVNIYMDNVLINDSISVLKTFQTKTLPAFTKSVTLMFAIGGVLGQNANLIEYEIDHTGNWKMLNLNVPRIDIIKPEYGTHTIKFRWQDAKTGFYKFKEWTFNIERPWYKSTLFYITVFILLVLLIYCIVHLRTIQQEKAKIKLEKEVQVKTHELQTLNKLLQKRERVKIRTIAILNHDLLAPLRYMGIAAGSTAHLVHNQVAKNAIREIAATSKSLELLTSNILNWVKYSDLEKLPPVNKICLKKLVQHELDFLSSIFKNTSAINIVNHIDEQLIIETRPDLLRVLIYNLLLNSFRATLSGSIEVSAINQETTNKKITIEVKDTGTGMKPEIVKYLLKETESLVDQDSEDYQVPKSNGVGYYIIHDLLKLLNGNIFIESQIDVGTKVKVTF